MRTKAEMCDVSLGSGFVDRGVGCDGYAYVQGSLGGMRERRDTGFFLRFFFFFGFVFVFVSSCPPVSHPLPPLSSCNDKVNAGLDPLIEKLFKCRSRYNNNIQTIILVIPRLLGI